MRNAVNKTETGNNDISPRKSIISINVTISKLEIGKMAIKFETKRKNVIQDGNKIKNLAIKLNNFNEHGSVGAI